MAGREEDFLKVAAKCPWISEYVCDYTKNVESPIEFNLLTAITIIGMSSIRATHLNYGTFRVYPNFYSLLVAPT